MMELDVNKHKGSRNVFIPTAPVSLAYASPPSTVMVQPPAPVP